jgi:hypothetical protein
MTYKTLNRILSQMKMGEPPRNVDLIVEISNIPWEKILDIDLDICSEILLEISADAIVVMFSPIEVKKTYLPAFIKISNDIKMSNILYKSIEFEDYFNKYISYVNEIESGI